MDRNPPASAGDTGLVPGLGRPHMQWSNYWARMPRACDWQQVKPPLAATRENWHTATKTQCDQNKYIKFKINSLWLGTIFCSCRAHCVPAVHLRCQGGLHLSGDASLEGRELCDTATQPQGGRSAQRWENRRLPVPVACSLSHVRLFATPGTVGLLCPWDSPGKNTGVGCHFLLQRIFPTQGSNPCLLRWQVDSLPLCHQGNRP